MSRKKLLRLVGTLTLLALLVVFLDLWAMRRYWVALRWQWWIAAFGCYLFAQVISSVRWYWLTRPLGIEVAWSRCLKLYFVGTFYNQLLPTSLGGDVVRAWNLSDRKEDRGAAFLSVFADRASGLGVLILMACVASLFVELPWGVQIWILVMACGMAVGIVAILWMLIKRSAPPLVPLSPEGRGVRGEGDRVREFPNISGNFSACVPLTPNPSPPRREGDKRSLSLKVRELNALMDTYLGRPALLARVALSAILIQTFNVILVWFLTWAVGLPVSLTYCFVLVPLVTLITLLPISLGGLGAREGGTILLLTPLAIAQEQAVTLSLLWLSVFSAVGVLGGVIYVFGSFYTMKGQPDDGSVDCDSDQGRERESRSAA